MQLEVSEKTGPLILEPSSALNSLQGPTLSEDSSPHSQLLSRRIQVGKASPKPSANRIRKRWPINCMPRANLAGRAVVQTLSKKLFSYNMLGAGREFDTVSIRGPQTIRRVNPRHPVTPIGSWPPTDAMGYPTAGVSGATSLERVGKVKVEIPRQPGHQLHCRAYARTAPTYSMPSLSSL